MNTETSAAVNPASDGTQFHEGLERHVWPASNGKGVVTKTSSDDLFGPEGLGLAGNRWMRILSGLARTGIQEQTKSNPGETDIDGCVKGWGQGACSSRVFNVEPGVDNHQLEKFISHLKGIARELGIRNERITDKVLASFIATQDPEPYLTWEGLRSPKTLKERIGARFRGHVQWQGFDTLCGQIDKDGVKHSSPELIRMFFNTETPFFSQIIERRRRLRDGSMTPGECTGVLADSPDYVDPVATDNEYKRNKSGLKITLKIIWYIIFPKRSKQGPLLAPQK